MLATLLYLSLLLVDATTQPSTAPAASGNPTVIVVVGAQGTSEYGRAFATWADRWAAAAKQRSAKLISIGRDGVSNDADADDKQKLNSVLKQQPTEGTDALWIILIGHGTFDSSEAKFNLRGPDVSDVELADWLKPIHRPVAVIDCASASAPFLNRLSAKGRVVITATRSGSEIQYSRFGDFLSSAITDPAADLDKDGQVSLLEAFLNASHRVNEFYVQESRLATEHALLDDNGDKTGVSADWFDGLRPAKAPLKGTPVDGSRANQWCLLPNARELAMSAESRARRDEMEIQLEALRAQKKELSSEAYYKQLEAILIPLARTYVDKPTTQPTH